MLYAQVHLTLPAWLQQLDIQERRYPDAESQVALAIDLSARNVAEGSGGPFGAAVFDGEGRLIGAGVNRVVPQHCSAAHGEMMAFMSAQQRAQLARVLAQVWCAEDAGDRLLLLDEPVASLDIGHQSLIMRALRRVAATGVTIVFVAHDVSLAAAHADRMLALADGGPVACGPPARVVTEATLERVFDADTHVIAHPVTGTPVVLHD